MRFELMMPFDMHAFQACALDRYANPPPIFLRLKARLRSLALNVTRNLFLFKSYFSILLISNIVLITVSGLSEMESIFSSTRNLAKSRKSDGA
jgi:hypothetical protein